MLSSSLSKLKFSGFVINFKIPKMCFGIEQKKQAGSWRWRQVKIGARERGGKSKN
jgi:hypothetical protein